MKISDFINDKAFLAIIPLVAYIATYQFERGYFSFFDVDPEFIQIDYQKVIALVAAGLALLSIIISINNHLTDLMHFQDFDQLTRATIIALFSLYFIGTLLGFVLPLSAHQWLRNYQYFIAAGLFFYFALPRERIPRRVSSVKGVSKFPSKNFLSGFFAEKIHPLVLPVIAIIWLLVEMAQAVGYSNASRCESFSVIDDGSDRFVIRQVGSSAIVKFRVAPASFDNRFQILPIADLKDLTLRKSNLGPMTESAPRVAATTQTATTRRITPTTAAS